MIIGVPEGLLFLERFAMPCAKMKLASGHLTEQQYKALTNSIINFKQAVNLVLFEICFPKIVCDYRDFYTKQNKLANFSKESVLEFLQATHLDKGHCSLRTAMVCVVDERSNVIGVCEGKTKTFTNPYEIKKLRTKDCVYIHYDTIIGKV
jgi:hypothetical protein